MGWLQIPGVTDKGSKAHTVKKVAVIGGGLMGSGIATALILSGVKVYLKEINSEFLQAGIQRIEGTTPRTLQKDYWHVPITLLKHLHYIQWARFQC